MNLAEATPEWFPAGIVSPMTGRRVEFIAREGGGSRAGSFLDHHFVETASNGTFRPRDVVSWRYLASV